MPFLGDDTEPEPWRPEKTWGQDIRERVTWAEETARGSLEAGDAGWASVTAGGPHVWVKQEVRLESQRGQVAKALRSAQGSGLGCAASKESTAWNSLRERTQLGRGPPPRACPHPLPGQCPAPSQLRKAPTINSLAPRLKLAIMASAATLGSGEATL